MKKISFLLALIPLLVACEKEDPPENEITVKVGDVFTIELTANWSTGYHWSWLNPSEITVADTIDFSFVTEDPSLGGSDGAEIWSFQAISPGEEQLIFAYVPPGDPDDDEVKSTFNIHVTD